MTAKVLSIITAQEARSLWENARDSFQHALEHFSELSLKNGEESHHKKWIVLSVHHAAEAFCNMLLKQFDPGNARFKKRGQDWYPSLEPAIDELLIPKNQVHLTGAEIRLLDLLKGLSNSRNSIMHGIMPKNLDLSRAAESILGLSRVAHRRRGESVEDILQQDPPIQTDIIEAIRYKRIEDYYRFVEAFLAEEFPGQFLPVCENCGISSIVNMRCEACFDSMQSYTCNSCDEEVLFPESQRLFTENEVVCPSCGKKLSG